MNTLPNKPSELIRMALADLEKCETDPRYVVDMNDWHAPIEDGARCLVCLAGSVMAKTLGVSPEQDGAPSFFSDGVDDKLCALDRLRTGDVDEAFDLLGLLGDSTPFERDVTMYSADRERFKSEMRTLADDLERAEL